MNRWRWLGGLGCLTVMMALAAAMENGESEPEQAIREASGALLPYFAAQPEKDLRERFSSSFLKAIEEKNLRCEAIFRDTFLRHGRASEARLLRITNAYAAEVEFIFEKGVRLPARLALDSKPPHRITALIFDAPIQDDDSLEAVVGDLKMLPGQAGFCLMRLDGKPEVIWEHRGDQPLAVASSMKLLVLAALVEEIRQERRTWSEVVPVRRAWASLPAGLVQDWPDGAPITLHTLATLMISRSDNTAADHLIHLLGQERLHQAQKLCGVTEPQRNSPFLSTAEAFKIKLVLPANQQQEYVKANASQRKKLLDTLVREASLAHHRSSPSPEMAVHVEWFFSPADMCRIADWLRRQSVRQGETEGKQDALRILAVNRGFSLDESHWTYVGYKGGLETGVVNFTLLLRDRRQQWYALSIGWNNAAGEADQVLLQVYAQRLLRLAQKR